MQAPIVPETIFSGTSLLGISGLSSAALDDSAALIAYVDYANGENLAGKSVVINASGGIERGPTAFHSLKTGVGPSSVAVLTTRRVLISYSDISDSGRGWYAVLDPYGNVNDIQHDSFDRGRIAMSAVTAVDSSTVLIAYRDDSDHMNGNFVVISTNTGSRLIPETTFALSINDFAMTQASLDWV
jgi:hypothetical protein